jgi:hypothetical protein
MNIVTVLHSKALEFADEALLAKMEGNRDVSHSLFEKAFSLEKEATTLIDQKKMIPGIFWFEVLLLWHLIAVGFRMQNH